MMPSPASARPDATAIAMFMCVYSSEVYPLIASAAICARDSS